MKLEMRVPLNIQHKLGLDYPDSFAVAQKAFWETDIGRSCTGSHVEFGSISAWSNGGGMMNVDHINVVISGEMRFKEPMTDEELVLLMMKYNGRLIDDDL
jgi:hypothetical protein